MADENIVIRPKLVKRNKVRAIKILKNTVDLLDKHNVVYHLEGGTLLGLVRNKDLLPWDFDVDISIDAEDIERFLRLTSKFRKLGFKIRIKAFGKSIPPLVKNMYRLFIIKPIGMAVLKEILPWCRRYYINLDVLIKYKDKSHTYWQANEKIMRVSNKYYRSYETITCLDKIFKVPNKYREYLTEKYGDWSIPVKEWDCGKNEKTIIASI